MLKEEFRNTRSGIKYTEAGKLVSFMRKGQCSLSDFLDAIKLDFNIKIELIPWQIDLVRVDLIAS